MLDQPIQGIDGVTDPSEVRVVLYNGTTPVHAPLDNVGLQPLDAGLTDIAALAVTDGNFIVGNGTNWVAESGTTALASLGIVTGTWTPTLTGVANVDTTTAAVCHYIRVGDHVMCFGVLTVDPTAAAGTTTTVGISLPIASNFAATTDCRGSSATAALQRGGSILADTTNDRAQLQFLSEVTAATGFSFSFGYQII